VAAASRGLGKAVALALAQERANVVMFSRDQAAIDAAAEEVHNATGARVVGVRADVTSAQDLAHVVEVAVEEFEGVDVLYNNAGGPKPGMFETLTDEDWLHAVDLDLMSAVRLTRLCLPHMRRQRWGRVITSTSSSVKQPIPNLMLSNSVRSATTAWAKTLADQVGPDGITVNVIAPGSISTDRLRQIAQDAAERAGTTREQIERQQTEAIPLRRYGTPAEFAAAAVFLASEQAAYISGVTLLVDGGAFRGTY
jgi:3-oxoacyl-[acyl-carrier protein] reductase